VKQRALLVLAGEEARQRLETEGWHPELFSLLLGASGGPKWLVLSQLDRVLLPFLLQRKTPLSLLGTSIGSWRHACYAQDDPVAAIERFERLYIGQRYTEKPGIDEVTEVSRGIMQRILGESGAASIVRHPLFQTHIGTARGKGLLASRVPFVHGVGLGLAAVSNGMSRSLLQSFYQRVVFSYNGDSGSAGMEYRDFSTAGVTLTENNVFDALMASASIPLVLDGVPSPAGAPEGTYWDGGIVDYHHDLRAFRGEGLVLYPHFYPTITPGWFDKALKGRRPGPEWLKKVVLLCPHPDFVATLPDAKVPDRKDFPRFSNDGRMEQWEKVVEYCKAMAEDWEALLQAENPLEHVVSFEAFYRGR
jgi:hypothetical protein